MENQNKPDWLIKAQEEMAKFAETKIGKMTEKEFRFSEKQSNAGKIGGKIAGHIQGKKNVESGHLESLRTTEHQSNAGTKGGKRNMELHKEELMAAAAQWKLDNPEKLKQQGIKMNENIDPEFRKQHNKKVANKIYVLSDGIILKNAFAKSNHIKKNPNVYVIKDLIQDDLEYLQYETIMLEQKENNKKPLFKNCQYCGKECKSKGLHSHEKKCIN